MVKAAADSAPSVTQPLHAIHPGQLDGALCMLLQQSLYHGFASVGGFIEIAAIITVGVLPVLTRGD
jgi:hypothetical protein